MSHGFDSLVFDLDGTLWDTCHACSIAWNNVVVRNSISFRTITVADVRAVTGNPTEIWICETFKRLPEEVVQKIFIETTAEDNRIIREKGGQIYLGVGEGLRELAGMYPLFIVSNCQAGYIEIFMEWSGFKPFFR